MAVLGEESRLTRISKAISLLVTCVLATILFCACPATAKSGELKPEPEFISIFNGKNLSGWEATPPNSKDAWSVKDGIIVGVGDKGRGYLTYSDNKKIANLELVFSYRFPGKGNSGVSIRGIVDKTGKRDFQSYHADLGHLGIGRNVMGAWDFHTPGRTEHRCFRGDSLVIDKNDQPHITPIKDALTTADIKQGDWNHVRVLALDNNFKLYVNGKLSSEFTENIEPGKRLGKGMIQLQLHDPGMIVHFRDVKLKVLD